MKLKRRPDTYTFEEYQEAAVRTAKPMSAGDFDSRIDRMVYGLMGEVGELAEYIKKARYQGHDYDAERVLEEMGDILWYLGVGADDLCFGLGTVALRNIDKLRERYPDGFSAERSCDR